MTGYYDLRGFCYTPPPEAGARACTADTRERGGADFTSWSRACSWGAEKDRAEFWDAGLANCGCGSVSWTFNEILGRSKLLKNPTDASVFKRSSWLQIARV